MEWMADSTGVLKAACLLRLADCRASWAAELTAAGQADWPLALEVRLEVYPAASRLTRACLPGYPRLALAEANLEVYHRPLLRMGP